MADEVTLAEKLASDYRPELLSGSDLEKFFAKVHVKPGCWEWLGCVSSEGYGRFTWRGKQRMAHRISYLYYKGAIPPNVEMDHLCRNRGCVNPDHLQVVSRRENWLRGQTPSRINSLKTHCPQGHPYDEDNTMWVRRGAGVPRYRQCRTCNKIRFKAYYWAKLRAKRQQA